jgi:spermidine/putrescine transport system permease protein
MSWTSKLAAAPALWLIGFVAGPLLAVLVTAFLSRGEFGELKLVFTLDSFWRALGFGEFGYDPLYAEILARSAVIAALSTGLCLALALPIVFFIAKAPGRLRPFLLFLLMVPFWTNLVIRTYAWQLILAPEGWLASTLFALGIIGDRNDLYPSLFAVCVGLTSDFLPFLALPLYSSVEKIDWSLTDAARDLGARPRQVFRHAILPQIMPGMIAGCVLTFIPILGSFVVSDLLGGAKTILIGNVITQQFAVSQDWPFGATLALILALVSLVGIYLVRGRLEARA